MADIPAWDEGIPLMPGDRLVLEPLPQIKGYWGSSGRTFHMGPAPEEEIRKAQVLDRGRQVAAEMTKPGVKTGDIMDAINDTLQEGGLECSLDQGGHGVGIDGQEPPAIALGETFEVEENMVLALECWFFDTDENGHHRVYGGEDYVHEVMELNRLVLLDNKKNQASFLIGNSMKMLPKPTIVVTYADSNMNHHGYTYQACNFIYTGLSKPRAKFFSPSGEEIAERTLSEWQGHNTRQETLKKYQLTGEKSTPEADQQDQGRGR